MVKKLPPYVIFKRICEPKNKKFNCAIIVRLQEKGWMDNDLNINWIKSFFMKN